MTVLFVIIITKEKNSLLQNVVTYSQLFKIKDIRNSILRFYKLTISTTNNVSQNTQVLVIIAKHKCRYEIKKTTFDLRCAKMHNHYLSLGFVERSNDFVKCCTNKQK